MPILKGVKLVRKNKKNDYIEYQVNDDFNNDNATDWDTYLENIDNKNKKNTDSEYNNELDFNFDDSKHKFKLNVKLCIIIFLYIMFVGLGGFLTTYKDNQPQLINVELREKRSEFKKIETHYNNMYNIVLEIDRIDASLKEASPDESLNYAVAYKDLADIVDKNIKDVDGTKYNNDYIFMQKSASAIYKNLKEYLTIMSDAMSAQNGGMIKQALSYKDKTRIQFEKYTDNINKIKESLDIE